MILIASSKNCPLWMATEITALIEFVMKFNIFEKYGTI